MIFKHGCTSLRNWVLCACAALGLSANAWADSVIGAGPLGSATAHNLGVGWPSVSYEWWHAGSPDWALGAEVVYGDWSGEFSDIDIGGAFNVPLRWQLNQSSRFVSAFRFTPGLLLADAGNSTFVLGVKGEMAIPVSMKVDPKVNIITGGAVPFTFYKVESTDPFIVLPLLARIGAEFHFDPQFMPWILVEMGPAIHINGPFADRAEFGFRATVGTAFF